MQYACKTVSLPMRASFAILQGRTVRALDAFRYEMAFVKFNEFGSATGAGAAEFSACCVEGSSDQVPVVSSRALHWSGGDLVVNDVPCFNSTIGIIIPN